MALTFEQILQLEAHFALMKLIKKFELESMQDEEKSFPSERFFNEVIRAKLERRAKSHVFT